MKAFVVNRIGDFGFSLGVFLLFWGLAAAPAGLLRGQGGEPARRPLFTRSRPGTGSAAARGEHGAPARRRRGRAR